MSIVITHHFFPRVPREEAARFPLDLVGFPCPSQPLRVQDGGGTLNMSVTVRVL